MEDSRLQDSERIRWIICALLLRLAVYALSSDLVRGIAHGPETLFTSVNVGYAEDLQMGTWVKNQAERRRTTQRKSGMLKISPWVSTVKMLRQRRII